MAVAVVVAETDAVVELDFGLTVGLADCTVRLCFCFFIARRRPSRGMSGIIISVPLPPTGIMLSGMVSFALYLATTLSPRLITSRPKRPDWLVVCLLLFNFELSTVDVGLIDATLVASTGVAGVVMETSLTGAEVEFCIELVVTSSLWAVDRVSKTPELFLFPASSSEPLGGCFGPLCVGSVCWLDLDSLLETTGTHASSFWSAKADELICA